MLCPKCKVSNVLVAIYNQDTFIVVRNPITDIDQFWVLNVSLYKRRIFDSLVINRSSKIYYWCNFPYPRSPWIFCATVTHIAVSSSYWIIALILLHNITKIPPAYNSNRRHFFHCKRHKNYMPLLASLNVSAILYKKTCSVVALV